MLKWVMSEQVYKMEGYEKLKALIKKDSIIGIFVTNRDGVNGRLDLNSIDNHLEPNDVLRAVYSSGAIRANVIVCNNKNEYQGNVVLPPEGRGA